MCGIFALLNNSNVPDDFVINQIKKGENRGPDNSQTLKILDNFTLGFHRLAINGLNQESNQPFDIDNVILICNGEIYNYKELYKFMNIKPKTDSDCEVIIYLYKKYGIEQTLKMLDGVFAFILYDILEKKIVVARDPYGVRPLYHLRNNSVANYNHIGFASELKCLVDIGVYNYGMYLNMDKIEQFVPGTYSILKLPDNNIWSYEKEYIPYFIPSFYYPISSWRNNYWSNDIIRKNIQDSLLSAVEKRCLNTERPIACLLSGGLDSSLIAALVNRFYKINNYTTILETYSIGLEGSVDLKYAKIVADYLGTKHTEVIVTEEEMFNAIPEVIYAIESYDTTTVRASIGNYLVGKYISKNSNAKVIFNGDGADELCGGYLYMSKCPDCIEFDKESKRLLKDIHTFDVLRSDKSISSHGLEPRTPYLDKTFVNSYLSISPEVRFETNKQIEKYLIRDTFALPNFRPFDDDLEKQILPNEVLWRKKEAFSDGVSSHGRSLYQILQEKIAEKLNLQNDVENTVKYEANIHSEKNYYSDIFSFHYPNSICENIIPYYWMPKYTNATDPSARTLTHYTSDKQ
jgi:asparagine synthase (glutamine-hydrolysing)